MGDGSGKKFGGKMERCLKNVTLRSFDSVLEFFAIMTSVCFFFLKKVCMSHTYYSVCVLFFFFFQD